MSIRYLDENQNYQLYALDESVYLKDKREDSNLSDYSKLDTFITCVYGDPDSGLLSFHGKYIAIAGCGLNIYDFES